MRTVKITMTVRCTEDHYQTKMVEIKNDILSGKMQREFFADYKDDGVQEIKATFEEIK